MHRSHRFPDTGAQVRVVQIDGNPWFPVADVCEALGLARSQRNGSYQAHYRGRLAPDEMRLAPLSSLHEKGLGNRRAALLSESGLYKLVLRAHPDRNPTVRAFQDWVTRDVLPAIRKDGAYVRGEEMLKPGVVEQLDTPRRASRAASVGGPEAAPRHHRVREGHRSREAAQGVPRRPSVETGGILRLGC